MKTHGKVRRNNMGKIPNRTLVHLENCKQFNLPGGFVLKRRNGGKKKSDKRRQKRKQGLILKDF